MVLNQLEGVFLSTDEADMFADWWDANLQIQVIETINSLENGVWI
jgi:hypothetical protein